MSDVRLIVGGRSYGGWKGVRVTRTIESLAGSFDLDVTDRWGELEEPWPIAEEDPCRVEIEGEVVVDGFIDKRSISIGADARTLGYSGRDRTAALVDCSAELDVWTFRNASVVDVASKVAEPFGIKVSVQAGLVLPKPTGKVVVSPGDTAFAVIDRAATEAGVLVVGDGAGGILITRAGSERAAPLVLGQNIKALSVDYDATERFARYVVLTQVGGTDGASGGATRIRGQATDAEIRRTERVMILRPEAGITADFARQRADWEARIRAARAEAVSITVLGWRQPSGKVWPVNALARVRAIAAGIDGDLLISQADYSIGADGEVTELHLVRPDAFTPEPKAVVSGAGGGGGGGGGWKELAGGAR
jgi:prophage tail gpP-like protein